MVGYILNSCYSAQLSEGVLAVVRVMCTHLYVPCSQLVRQKGAVWNINITISDATDTYDVQFHVIKCVFLQIICMSCTFNLVSVKVITLLYHNYSKAVR